MITVKEAAIILEGNESWIRSLTERNVIGDAWSANPNATRKTYVIVPSKLAAFMQISEDELNARLKEVRECLL